MKEEKPEKTKYRITALNGGLTIGLGVVFDVIQAFLTSIGIGLLVNWIISLWAFMTFGLWFYLLGVMDLKRWLQLGATLLGESMPLVNSLPIWVGIATFFFLQTRAEDVAAKLSPAASAAIKKLSGGKI